MAVFQGLGVTCLTFALVTGLAGSGAAQAPGNPRSAGPPGDALLPADRERPAIPQQGSLAIDPLVSEPMRSDAGLNDVCFVDPQHGWAVGDRGTIWAATDGGHHWQLQESGVSCRLESVWFLNAEVGWAAGGVLHPYLTSGSGVLLFTQDGGKRWSRDPGLVLPYLKRVRFFNARSGWAVGCPSAMFPSGVFTTETGGRNWQPIPAGKSPGWTAADFLNGQTAALVGRGGAVAAVRGGQLEAADVPRLGLRGASNVRLSPRAPSWLVGQGGLVLSSGDGGALWTPPPNAPPPDVLRQFDFAALEVRGPKCWIAGSPGTRVMHTPDGGRTWFGFPTGQTLPIHALSFLDDQTGWAVGALGTILATNDGGQTWKRQRAGGTRTALLGLFGEPRDVPLEVFARFSGNEGYLGVVELVNRRDMETPSRGDTALDDRVHEALLCVGACGARTAWQFPLRQPGLELTSARTLDAWNESHRGRARDELEGHLVRQIRLWRPEAIVVRDAAAAADRPAMRLLHEAVLQAAALASDPAAFPDQMRCAGLSPWQVGRVYSANSGAKGATTIAPSQLADRLGRSLGDVAGDARSFIQEWPAAEEPTWGLDLALDQRPQEQGRRDLLGGLAPGSEARRALLDPSPETLEQVRRAAQRRRTVEAIVQRTQRDPRAAAGLVAQAGELTRGLGPDSAAEVLHQLAECYRRNGQWALAAEIFDLLADQHPGHPLARPAMLWLVAYYSSGEAASRLQNQERDTVRQASTFPTMPLVGDGVRYDRARAAANRLQQVHPDSFAESAVGFQLAALERQGRQPRQAEQFYNMLRRGPLRGAWWACAQGEQWLAEPRGNPPKPVLHCPTAPSRPRLDGRLDDPLWQTAQRAELRSPLGDDADWPAEVLLAHDDQFLYLAVRARKVRGGDYSASTGPRPRDGDLRAHDRVELLLDLDRDFTTYYRLAIDHRGWTNDDCWDDTTWDPTWFVAADSTGESWVAEAAIPIAQLSGSVPAKGAAWAIGVQRVVPGTGFQSWNTPAAVRVVPEGFGYLVFD